MDFPAFKAKRDAYVTRLNGLYRSGLENLNIRYVEGTASFIADKIVKVGE